jgi:chromosome segregation ATPase
MAYEGMGRGAVFLALLLLTTGSVAGQTASDSPARPATPRADAAQKLDTVVKEQIKADEDARASQERVNQLDDETQRLLAEYRKATADTESYQAYSEQLTAQVRSQTEEMQTIDRQLLEVETTAREVLPLMQKMLDTLERFVALDVPFLAEERANRVAALKQMMTRADVTISEKYRRILEAYQVELDYGRTIEAYEAALGSADGARTVQFLRVGRVSLLYQTLDGRETGFWDASKKGWVVDDDYRHTFTEGVAVAKKLRAPEMLIVPVPAAKQAGS